MTVAAPLVGVRSASQERPGPAAGSPESGQPHSYVFTDPSERETARLGLLAALLDPQHRAALEAAAVGPASRCLEVGAGAGTIARWLASRLGPGGHVEATDIDLTHLTGPVPASMTVRRLDVTTDPLPERSFDLITARNVLHHLPGWREVIARLSAALRPGGYLVLVEPDTGSGVTANTDAALRRFWDQWNQWGHSAGVDYLIGHQLPAQVSAAGLTVQRASLDVPFYNGGSDWADLFLRTVQAVAPRAKGAIDPDLLAAFRRSHADPGTWMCSFGFIAMTARKEDE
jgi:SAM-dependent methyltransferase